MRWMCIVALSIIGGIEGASFLRVAEFLCSWSNLECPQVKMSLDRARDFLYNSYSALIKQRCGNIIHSHRTRRFLMQANEGKWDRIIRVILGLILFYVGYAMLASPWNYVAYVLGLISLVTGLIGFCLIYSIFKINTKGG